MSSDCIITDCNIIGAEGCPEEIAAAGNEPWRFLGEVPWRRPSVEVICPNCSPRPCVIPRPHEMFDVVCSMHLDGHKFVTEDMLEVIVYWGRCPRCRRVSWARSGPPFRYARRYVHA